MTKDEIILDICGVTQVYGDNKVLYDIDIKVVRGQFVGLVGQSGCGKSTLLRMIQGTEQPTEGSVFLDGEIVTCPTRHIGMVYQRYNLYDFLTVEQNVALGPMLDQTCLLFGNLRKSRTLRPLMWWNLRKQHTEQAHEILSKLRLQDAMKKYPFQLSGGMQQRVSIAQALIMKPKILLLDEPFGALDESTREELQKLLLVLYQENMNAVQNNEMPPHTVILITHELNEAFYCCDRVIGLSRMWTHKSKSGKTLQGRGLGATKIYDKAAPVYHPNDEKNFDKFVDLMKDLKRVVINSNNDEQDRYEHVSFWGDLAQGIGTGVALEEMQ